MKKLAGFLVALMLAISPTAWAQGTQTGTLSGTVTDQDGLVLPGVTVTVTSPALQGARSTVTDGNGVYTLRGLPPGDYQVRFELSGLRTVEARQQVSVGQPARVDATLQLATVTETVEVTAEVPTLIQTVQGGANYAYQEINKLASPRTLQGIAELAPGLTDNTPNAGQVTISGSFAYDNQFMVDGVDVADNLFGNANNLFIEDALEEVQVLTSGISAEFGRFGGGVVNAVTKSGSNTFSGSYRANPYKPSWTKRTPFEVRNNTERTGDVLWVHEGTFGGPILRDRLWFFTAGRRQKGSTPAPFPETGIDFSNVAENNRLELKGTGTLAANHTLQASYIRNQTTQTQASFNFSVEPNTVVTRELPNDLWIVNYRGVLGSKLFATAQLSRREFGFRNTGGTDTAIVNSPFITRGFTPGVTGTRHFNAPYFDSTDPEDRNNRQFAGSLSYFLSTAGAGSHDIKGGYENFTTTRVGGNSQSATGFVFATDYLVQGGRPVLDANNRPIPIFTPGAGNSRLENWLPTRGAQIDITTHSFFVHDRWSYSSNLTLDLGVRAEVNKSEATGDIVGVDTSRVVPRLGATYDLTGEGKYTLQTTYAHYAHKYSETQFADNTDVGTPSLLLYEYAGPAGQGRDFTPGFTVANYRLIGGNFPTANVFFDDNLKSPLTREFTVSGGAALGSRGAAKLTYQWRETSDFIETFIDDPNPATGHIPVVRNGVNFGTFNRVLISNSDAPVREYQALVLQSNYRLLDRWTANAHWTVQLRNDGNFEGENTNQPGISSDIGDYPEMLGERNFPLGQLNDFQRHKVRAWTTYTLGLGPVGAVDTSFLWRYNSPLTFSYTAAVPISPIQASRNPGYARPPTSQTLYFGDRGEGEFEDAHLFDLAATYQVPVFRTLRPWLKFEVYNLFNNQSLVGFNTAVTANNAGARDADGLPTEFVRGANFGTATAITHFPRATNTPAGAAVYARTWLVSFGFRF